MSLGVPKPTPKPRTRPEPVPPAVRSEVLMRQGFVCPWCEVPDNRLLVMHHRLRRSQGGRHEARTLVGVHVLCHGQIHDAPALAKRRGFLVSSEQEL